MPDYIELPHDVESEQAVLGAVLESGDCLRDISSMLQEGDFYDERHRIVWRAIRSLEGDGRAVDELSVVTRLRDHKALTRAGGSAYITQVVSVLPDVANVTTYAQQVKDASVDRSLFRIGRNLQSQHVKPADKIDIAFSELTELNRNDHYQKDKKIGSVCDDIMHTIIDGNGVDERLMIGFGELDEILQIGHDYYVVLAARPGVGKSAFSLQVATNVARYGSTVLYISPEMSRDQLGKRQLSVESGVPHDKLVKPRLLDEDDICKLREANERIKAMPLIVNDKSEQNITSVRLAARRIHSGQGLSLIVVDYLQLLCSGDDTKEAVTTVSKGLKAIARDLNVPLWACSQLRRPGYEEANKRPDKSMLRGSGQIEQDADQVLMMWCPDQKNRSKVEIFVDKNRHGRTGGCIFKFDKNTTRFQDLSGRW